MIDQWVIYQWPRRWKRPEMLFFIDLPLNWPIKDFYYTCSQCWFGSECNHTIKLEGNNHNKGQTYLLNFVIGIWGYYLLKVLSITISGHLPSAGTFYFILWAMTLYEIYNVLPLRIWGHFMQQCRFQWKCTEEGGEIFQWKTIWCPKDPMGNY